MVRRYPVHAAAVLLLSLGLILSGCGSGETDTPVPESATESPKDTRDGALVAYEAAAETVVKVVPDALLLSVGSQGVSQSRVPSAWSFLFLSPADGHLWRVGVDQDTPSAAEDLGQSQVPIDGSSALDLNTVTVWAETAVTVARAAAGASGEVPPNVLVIGGFMELPGATGTDSVFGVWKIAFVEGTSTEGAREFTVNMINGEIIEAPK